MGGNNRRATSAGNQEPTNLSAVGKLASFVQTTITNLLPGQPRWVKGSVLFLFVFLFIYIVVVTLQGSMVLPIEVRVALTKEERAARAARSGINLPKDRPAYDKPKPGYQIYHGGYFYGLNGAGHARIDLQVTTYTWIRTFGNFEVIISTPENLEFSQKVSVTKGVGSIFFDRESAQASLTTPLNVQVARASAISFVDQAVAAVSGHRLYLQAVTVPARIGAENISATLSLNGQSHSLQVLTNELAPSRETTLLVKGGASTVQDYRAFFAVPEGSKLSGASVRVQGPSGLFTGRYSEVFRISDDLKIGEPTALTGDSGGTLVLQLTYPVDVVFFERRETDSTTESLIRSLASLGLATRTNDAFATVPGSYNVMYAGADVPIPVLRSVIPAIAAEVPLRRIQTGIKLSNGKQNQIQIGSNATVSCLPVIEPEKIKRIVAQKTDEGFQRQVRSLPSPSSCKAPA